MAVSIPSAKKVATTLLLGTLAAVAVLAFVAVLPAALAAAESIHLPTYAAWAYALLADVGTVTGILGALILSDKKGRRFAVTSVAIFALMSGSMNVAHALNVVGDKVPAWLLVAYGLLGTLALYLSTETASRVAVALTPELEGHPLPKKAATSHPAERFVGKPAGGSKAKNTRRAPTRTDDVLIAQGVEVARRRKAQGKPVTITALKDELRTSWDRAKAVHAVIEANDSSQEVAA
ncbi:hypothetical protein [Nocardioides sp. NPDC006273]|uniref:hypothetical protein n=1 Tax=Nocardioides sp. NPDC006273 TaxID=3155598 RepID=UPI0033B9E10F